MWSRFCWRVLIGATNASTCAIYINVPFTEYDGVSKGVSFRSDASSCVEPCRTLHRSVVQELLDGEIEIHRSNSILSTASSAATSSSKLKPVAMVQPRKVQGVRVLPASSTAGVGLMQPIPKPRSLQQKPPFSGPRRQRNIQRAPAIRSAKPYVSSRLQVANPAANQDAHEFQRVGLKLRGTNRSTGQRQVAKETTTKTTSQTGHEVRHFLQDSKRFRLKHLAKVKDGNWRTATRVATLSGMREAGPTPLAAEADRMMVGPQLDGRMTETLLQAKKKDAEIAALLLQVQKDELDADSKRTSSDFENSSLISMQTNFENSLGYFP